MNTDPEIQAMSKVADALNGLEPEVVGRVIRWVAEKYNVSVRLSSGSIGVSAANVSPVDDSAFPDFATLFAAADPDSDVERALVAGFWLQEIKKNPSWDSQSANTELKNLGYPIGNITRALDNLMASVPRLAMQVEKSGNSKQARKKYKLTTEGIKKVQGMMASQQ